MHYMLKYYSTTVADRKKIVLVYLQDAKGYLGQKFFHLQWSVNSTLVHNIVKVFMELTNDWTN